MPYRPKRPCSFPGCAQLSDGQYCIEHDKIMEARYNKHERDPATKRRYGPAWERIRTAQLAAHPLCHMCLREGTPTPATEVHHILPLSQGGTYGPENLMSICKPCHSRITARESGWRRRR